MKPKLRIAAAVLGAAALLTGAYFGARRVVAFLDYRAAMDAADKGEYAQAATRMSRAAKRAPEYTDWATYFLAMKYMANRDETRAIAEFEKVAHVFGEQRAFRINYRIARLNHAWESDDYVAYLEHAEELIAMSPDNPESVMCYAAGNAYRYAQTGAEDFRRKSEEHLARLETMDEANAYDERIARIRRCLETRVIPPH